MRMRRCANCMEEITETQGNVCPCCGFDNDPDHADLPPHVLRWNTILHGRYLVGKVLGQGGFGITYIGFDLALNVKVAIKEYYPTGFVTRDHSRSNTLIWARTRDIEKEKARGNENFLKEARRIAKIDRVPSIVRVIDTFSDNETSYIVMEYIEGETLKEKLLREGVMTYADCIALMTPMLEDLGKVHELGIIHRDFSPDNIMLQPDGSIKLLDLGAAMSAEQSQQSQLVTKNGFSPLEQYAESGSIGAWTDVYAICATICYCITGLVIPSAPDRLNGAEIDLTANLLAPLPPAVEAVLRDGLAIDPKERISSVRELLDRLAAQKPRPKPKKRLALICAGAAAAVLLILLLIPGVRRAVFPAAEPTGDERESAAGPVEEAQPEEAQPAEEALHVTRLGNSNSNIANYGGFAAIDHEFQYFTSGDSALNVCPYNAETGSFIINDSVKVCDTASYITPVGEYVYFVTTDQKTWALCRMNKDGSDVTHLYDIDEWALWELQYAQFSDGREYFYFLEDMPYEESVSRLIRYDLTNGETEMLLEGELLWFNLYDDSIYYTENDAENAGSATRLIRTDLEGRDPVVLTADKALSTGFVEEDKIFLWSRTDETILVYDLDGAQNSAYGVFYELQPMQPGIGCFAYGDGWIYYSNAADSSVHRVRTNGTGDSVFMTDRSCFFLCYDERYELWFVEDTPTDRTGQYVTQTYLSDGALKKIFTAGAPYTSWKLETAREEDFVFETGADGGAVVTGYTGPMKSFAIPDELGGLPVTAIGDEAFAESGIMQLGLPDGMRSIGDLAFSGCGSLLFIGLPDGLESIGYGAFSFCENLTDVDLPNSLTAVGQQAFFVTSLSRVYIPANLTDIGMAAFEIALASGFTAFEIDSANPSYEVVDGVLFNIAGNGRFLTQFPVGRGGSYAVPDGTTGIEYYAFAYCTDLTEVTIPSSVKALGGTAFEGSGVTEVAVSGGCTIYGDISEGVTITRY